MTGLSNYTSDNLLNYITGQVPEPSLPAVYLALFTGVGTDAGTGFTEVSGGSYARVQVAGTLTASSGTTTSSPTLNFSSVPSWIVAGMTVYDETAAAALGTVSSTTGTTVVLTANAAHAVTTSDVITFSVFGNPSGTAPSTITNTGIVTFATSTASWGTVISFGLYDASSSGNLLAWDFIGAFSWLPFEVPTGSNPTFSVKANGFSSNDPLVFTAEYGGTLPSASTGTFTGYNVLFAASPSTDSTSVDTTSGPTTPVVLTSSGSGMVRKIVQQSIPNGITASFGTSQLTITSA